MLNFHLSLLFSKLTTAVFWNDFRKYFDIHHCFYCENILALQTHSDKGKVIRTTFEKTDSACRLSPL
jgi:hypothetical protein